MKLGPLGQEDKSFIDVKSKLSYLEYFQNFVAKNAQTSKDSTQELLSHQFQDFDKNLLEMLKGLLKFNP